jgi:hypothetical protein
LRIGLEFAGLGIVLLLVLALIAARIVRPQYRRLRFGIFVERERFDEPDPADAEQPAEPDSPTAEPPPS